MLIGAAGFGADNQSHATRSMVDGLIRIAPILGGQPFAEDRLLSIAAAYQSVTDGHRRRPADPSPLAARTAARYLTAEEAAATMK